MSSEEIFQLATRGVQGLKPYEPGKPLAELEREFGLTDAVKLASNENPLGMSRTAQEAIQQALKSASLYPDGNAFYLKKAIAQNLSIDDSQITIGNGSNDVLELAARCFANADAEIIYSQYAFAVYPIVTQAIGATHVVAPAKNWGYDLNAIFDRITNETAVIFIANPNNPTGTYVGHSSLRDFIASVPKDIIVVVDEAYHEYIDKADYHSALSWVNEFSNLIVTRTFSKAYGLAGLRIGYSVSHPAVANVLNRVRQPFNANSIALAAAEAALSDTHFLQQSVALNCQGMAQLTQAFNRLNLDYIDSVGNFISVDLKQDGQMIFDALLRKGVIVRPIGAYQMPNHIRVSIGTESENTKFIIALESALKEMRI